MSMNNSGQLLLGFSVRNDADFDSFFAPGPLRLARATLIQCVNRREPDCIFLSGGTGSGKSHLLQAVCNAAYAQQLQAIYLPMQQLCSYDPAEVLEAVDLADFVCIDDIDVIAANQPWQEAVFHLYNKRFMAEKPIYFSASVAARHLPFELADLISRLCACLAFQLPALNDQNKAALLQHLAHMRGIIINDASASYIIQRGGRSTGEIVSMLEQLDRESLMANRKITVPFIKTVMGW